MLNSSIFYWAQSLHSIIFRWNDYIRFTHKGERCCSQRFYFDFHFTAVIGIIFGCHIWFYCYFKSQFSIIFVSNISFEKLLKAILSPWTCLFKCIQIPFQFQSTILSHHHWGFYFYFICNLFMRSESFVVNHSYLSSVVALCTGKDFMPNLFRFIKFLELINTNTNKIDC